MTNHSPHKFSDRTDIDRTGTFVSDLFVAEHDLEAAILDCVCLQCLHRESYTWRRLKNWGGFGCPNCRTVQKRHDKKRTKIAKPRLWRESFVVCEAADRFRGMLHLRIVSLSKNPTRITHCGMRHRVDRLELGAADLLREDVRVCPECNRIAEFLCRFEQMKQLDARSVRAETPSAGCRQ